MTNFKKTILFLLLSPLICFAKVQYQGSIETTKIGNKVISYKGIPYAQPPIGALRWVPPQPVSPPDGTVVDARAFKAICPQTELDKDTANMVMSEDCLHLNIWRPLYRSYPVSQKLPVIVWIHGGGFVKGASQKPVYHGGNMAAKGVVFVSMNYRLGHLGFFAHKGQSKWLPRGNYGLLDQIEAMKWVQANISQFGGDPDNVTLMGESAGAVSVLAHLTSDLSKGLFHKAVVQSGPVLLSPTPLSGPSKSNRLSGEDVSANVAKALQCDDTNPARELRCLKKKSFLDLLNVTAPENGGLYGNIANDLQTGVFLDGHVHKVAPYKRLMDSTSHNVPVIIGSNEDEATFFGPSPFRTVPTYKTFLTSTFGWFLGQKMFQQYPATTNREVPQAFVDMVTDHMFGFDALFTAENLAANQQKVYHYHFTRVSPGAELYRVGASHGLEIPFFFNNVLDLNGAEGFYDSEDVNLADDMSERIYQFALTSNPNLPDSNKPNLWKKFDMNKRITLELGDRVRRIKDYLADEYNTLYDAKAYLIED